MMPKSVDRLMFDRDLAHDRWRANHGPLGGKFSEHEAVLAKHGFKRTDGSAFKRKHPDGSHHLEVVLHDSEPVTWRSERHVDGAAKPHYRGRSAAGLDRVLDGWKKPATKTESRADALIGAKLRESAPLHHGLTGKSFPTAKPKTDAERRAHTDDRDLIMSFDFDDPAAARAKAQQLANIHHREVGITKQPSGKHRVHHLSGMESANFVSKSDQRVSPNTHADGSLIKDEDVVKFGDLRPGERFRFFQSTPINVKHDGGAYAAPNTAEGKSLYYAPHRTVQRMSADRAVTQPLRRRTR